MADGQRCDACGAELPANPPEGLCPKCMLKLGLEDEPDVADGNPHRQSSDLQLLFGVLAVQLRRVTPVELMDVAAAWATDPSRGLAERLVEADVLSEADRGFIEDVVERAIEASDGDVSMTLDSLGGDAQVSASFCGVAVRNDRGGIEPGVRGGSRAEGKEPKSVPVVHETPGRYSEVGEYSRGGMGRILLVHDEYVGRDVALKEILLPPPDSPDGSPTPVRQAMPIVARFLQEARITGRLEHPGVVPVYELGQRSDGRVYYTMKLVRGRTMAKAIQETQSLEERLTLMPHFLDLCQAIAYAHSKGVIHRDLKPANVMIGEFGETVVIDWGLAKAVDIEDVRGGDLEETVHRLRACEDTVTVETAYGSPLGTPAYMSPEQARGQVDQVDERSDVYALGAVLYELLTGQPPFARGTVREILEAVQYGEPEPVASLESRAPMEFVSVCEHAMRKDPAERYPNARALAEEVQGLLDRERELRLAAEYARNQAEKARTEAERELRALLLQQEVSEGRLAYASAAVGHWVNLEMSGTAFIRALIRLVREGVPRWHGGGLPVEWVNQSRDDVVPFDPRVRLRRREKALLWAALRNRPTATRVLLAMGADPKKPLQVVNWGAVTPLMVAAGSNSRNAAQVLVSAGAAPGYVNEDGLTALMAAAEEDNQDLVQLLLDAGGDPYIPDRYGMNVPMMAAAVNGKGTIQVVLEAGGDPDYTGAEGTTLLMAAALWGSKEVVRILLEAGADPNLTDAHGMTALDMACQMAHASIVEMLRQAGGRHGKEGAADTEPAAASFEALPPYEWHFDRQPADQYEVIEHIGQGGMGDVYKAVHRKRGSVVALKILDRRYDLEEEKRKRDYLGREALLVAGLNHENVVKLSKQIALQMDPEGNIRRCLVEEYIDGHNLRKNIEERDLTLSQNLDLCVRFCRGLDLLHRSGIVHRDVKPENLVVSHDLAQAKIVDFGLSGSRTAWRARVFREGGGTRRYMSPEQLTRLRLDACSDVFSFGVSMYELLTGRHPCSASDSKEIMLQLRSSKYEFVPPSDHNAEIPPQLDRVILRALERDPEERYQTASEMLADLEQIAL